MITRYSILLIGFTSLLLSACSKEDTVDPAGKTETSIILDNETVDLKMLENINVQIKEGNGDYSVFSLNDDIAAVTLDNNNLEIQGKKPGCTYIIISDKQTQLKSLPVTVYQYNEIKPEKETVDIEFKLGNQKTVKIDVLEGNGGYSAIAVDKTIATAESSGNSIIITAQGKEGSTEIVITDASKRQTIISVNTKSTTLPYDKNELSVIMEDTTTPDFVFNGGRLTSTKYTYLNTVEDGMNLSGFNIYNYYILNIYYPGDKTVGVKQNCKIRYQNFPYNGHSSNGVLDLEYFEIIKNDGSKIWAVFSLIENNVLKWGYFRQVINP